MRKTILLVSQVYVPDPAAVGQHLHDAAKELVARGHRVVVLTSERGHDDPSRRYPRRQELDGVLIRRIALGNLGKSSIAVRIAGSVLFLTQATLRSLFEGRVDHVLISTSPPLAPPFGMMIARALGCSFTLWVMDLNPDQVVISGAMKANSPPVLLLDWSVAKALRAARSVVVLDHHMRRRVLRKAPVAEDRIATIPPWPLEEQISGPLERADNPLRSRLGLHDAFIVMYSGNLSPAQPLDTLLRAAVELQAEERLWFLFIGDGLERRKIEEYRREHPRARMRLLPYEPKEQLRSSLSAADVHVVSLGDDQVGIVHPCKVYGVMAMERPFLYFGPRDSHIGDLVEQAPVGWRIPHGDVAGTVFLLRQLLRTSPAELRERGVRARRLLLQRYSRDRLVTEFVDCIERAAVASEPTAERVSR